MSKKLLLLFPLIFFGCLQYEEKMKLYSDGSGEVVSAIGINSSIFSLGNDTTSYKGFNEESIIKQFEHKKGIKVLGTSRETKDGIVWIRVNLSFDSLEDLVKAAGNSSEYSMLGEMTLTENEDGNFVFERKIGSSNPDKNVEDTDDEIGKGMLGAMFGQYKWTYELTLPGKIVSTNLKESEIDRGTNQIKLSYPLATLDKVQPIKIVFEKGSRLNAWMFLLLLVVASTLGYFIFYLLKSKKDTKVAAT